eukprot:10328338-Prorocentrum_lima.AAC.1
MFGASLHAHLPPAFDIPHLAFARVLRWGQASRYHRACQESGLARAGQECVIVELRMPGERCAEHVSR